MTLDILFLDQDYTLGNFRGDQTGLYPHTAQFLEAEKDKGRKLYIATTAGASWRRHLASVDHLLSGYFGRELIDASLNVLYLLPDGTVRKLYDDFQSAFDFLTLEEQRTFNQEQQERIKKKDRHSNNEEYKEAETMQEEINSVCALMYERLLHKITKEPFDETSRYKNPHMEGSVFTKDIWLARRLIAPQDYASLRTVMVGDDGDKTSILSDPQTPLIIVSNKVQEGNWDLVSRLTDKLFSDPSQFPWQVYDELYAASQPVENKRQIVIDGIPYLMRKNVNEITDRVRIVECPE